MKRFDRIKTIQLVILIALVCVALVTILRSPELFRSIAADPEIRGLSIILWLVCGLSFLFLLYDFNSYTGLKRENMELDNAVYSDALTGIANRYSVDVYIGKYLNIPLPEDMGCVTIDLTNLAELNERFGHAGGDAAIQAFSGILQSAAAGVCFIGRNGGNKFLAIFRECSQKRLDAFTGAVWDKTAERNAQHRDAAISYSIGTAFDEGEEIHTLTELVALSDRRAYAAQSLRPMKEE